MEGGAAVLQPQKGFLRVRSYSPGAMRTVAWRRAQSQDPVLFQHQGQRQRAGGCVRTTDRSQGACSVALS